MKAGTEARRCVKCNNLTANRRLCGRCLPPLKGVACRACGLPPGEGAVYCLGCRPRRRCRGCGYRLTSDRATWCPGCRPARPCDGCGADTGAKHRRYCRECMALGRCPVCDGPSHKTRNGLCLACREELRQFRVGRGVPRAAPRPEAATAGLGFRWWPSGESFRAGSAEGLAAQPERPEDLWLWDQREGCWQVWEWQGDEGAGWLARHAAWVWGLAEGAAAAGVGLTEVRA